MMKTHTQLHNDFSRFNESSRRNQWISLLIKLDATKGAKTTMPKAQTKLIMLVTTYRRLYEFVFRATTSIQHVYPFQYPSQVTDVCTCITDHGATQGTRNPRAKFQSAPAQGC